MRGAAGGRGPEPAGLVAMREGRAMPGKDAGGTAVPGSRTGRYGRVILRMNAERGIHAGSCCR